MTNIYVLRCEGDRYYIGTSGYIPNRIKAHFAGKGSEFTKKYKLLEVIESIENVENFMEDDYVKQYMSKYGIENVRGGSYCQLQLTENTIQFLKNELSTVSGVCFRCQRSGHFVKSCYAKTKADGTKLEKKVTENKEVGLEKNVTENKEVGLEKKVTENKEVGLENKVTKNKEAKGHDADNTVSNITNSAPNNQINNTLVPNGDELLSSILNGIKSAVIQFLEQPRKIPANNIVVDNFCSRCYRKGHVVSKCYAKTMANGDIINQ